MSNSPVFSGHDLCCAGEEIFWLFACCFKANLPRNETIVAPQRLQPAEAVTVKPLGTTASVKSFYTDVTRREALTFPLFFVEPISKSKTRN